MAGHTVLHELQKGLVEATGLLMGSSRTTRKTGPSIRASPENPELAAGRRRPVEHGCILRDKLWTRLHRGCDLLRIRLRGARCWHLSVGDSRNEYQESNALHRILLSTGAPVLRKYLAHVLCSKFSSRKAR